MSPDALVEQYADIALAGVAGSAIEPGTIEQFVTGRRLYGVVAGLARAAAADAGQSLRGGFIEFLFGDRARSVAPPPAFYSDPAPAAQLLHAYNRPAADPELEHRAGGYETDPQFLRQQVDYHGKEASGTIVIDTPHHFLHLVAEGGRAMRYGVRVGRPASHGRGRTRSRPRRYGRIGCHRRRWSSVSLTCRISCPAARTTRSARALYLGSTLYRSHGANEPWTTSKNVSSCCIYMRNAHVIDVYERAKIGTRVVVL